MHPIDILWLLIPPFFYSMVMTILSVGKVRPSYTSGDAAFISVLMMLMVGVYLWLLYTYGGF